MKRKIATLLVTCVLSTALLLGGCSGMKSDTMTVSQMLSAIVEDCGGEAVLYVTRDMETSTLGKDTRVVAYTYDGKTCMKKDAPNGDYVYGYKLGDMAKGYDVRSDGNLWDSPRETTLAYVTDETGNAIKFEYLDGVEVPASWKVGAFFNSFSRITIYDKTYMTFSGAYNTGASIQKWYVVIEDTKSTKDKTIVCDEIGTEGIIERGLKWEEGYSTTW